MRRFFRGARPAWTRDIPLPGGDFAREELGRLASDLAAAVPALGEATSHRLVRAYGTIARKIFADRPDAASDAPGLGFHFGAGLYEREVAHLVKNEWAMTAEDVLWRRSKLGLHIDETGRRQLSDWLMARLPANGQLLQACSAQDASANRRCNG